MDQQDATLNEGASVQDRLERYLAAEDASAKTQDTTQVDDQASTAAEREVEPDDDGNSQVTEPQITTTELAKVLGLDEDALDLSEDGTIKLKTKIDGQEGAAKLADLLKSYQLEGHVNKRSMEVAEREKALQAQAQQVESQAQARLQQVEALASIAAQELTREFQSINWQVLEQQDPGQAALMRQKFQERQFQLQGVFQEVEQNKVRYQYEAQSKFQQTLKEEAQKLPNLIPEWKDEAVANKERAEIRDWAIKQGFPAESINSVNQAFAVVALRKAMLFDKLQQSKPSIENKVRTAPKIVKPGQAVQNTQAQTIKNLKQTVIKSGGQRDAVAEYLMKTGIA